MPTLLGWAMGDGSGLPARLGILPFRNKVLLPGAIVRVECTSASRYDSLSVPWFPPTRWGVGGSDDTCLFYPTSISTIGCGLNCIWFPFVDCVDGNMKFSWIIIGVGYRACIFFIAIRFKLKWGSWFAYTVDLVAWVFLKFSGKRLVHPVESFPVSFILGCAYFLSLKDSYFFSRLL